MSFASVPTYTPKQTRAAQRVLDSLDRLDERTQSIYDKQRRHSRRKFRSIVTICLLDSERQGVEFDSSSGFEVWGRSISESGLSFISPAPLHVKSLFVGIPLPNSKKAWFNAKVVRTREIAEEGFWEYGVAFLGRAEN